MQILNCIQQNLPQRLFIISSIMNRFPEKSSEGEGIGRGSIIQEYEMATYMLLKQLSPNPPDVLLPCFPSYRRIWCYRSLKFLSTVCCKFSSLAELRFGFLRNSVSIICSHLCLLLYPLLSLHAYQVMSLKSLYCRFIGFLGESTIILPFSAEFQSSI